MQTVRFLALAVVAAAAAHADFSYITVTKGPAGETTTRHYIKGQKSITDNGSTVTIMDFNAQAVTIVNRPQKTYSVKAFSDLTGKAAAAPAGTKMNADIKKTGQHKNIGGFETEELVVTLAADNSQAQAQSPGIKGLPPQVQMEMHMWLASDVPGIEELRAFNQKNIDRMPWAAMSGGMSGMAEIQRKLAALRGIPVMSIVKMGGANPQRQAQMEQARAQVEAMKKQGGAQAALADKMLAQMGGPSEITNESSGFSTLPVSDSVFAIPPDYKKVDK
jgi:hypothetical protein